MRTAFQGTGVHVGPSCFVPVGKEDLCLDEGDTISTTLCISRPPALRPDAESYLGEERIDRHKLTLIPSDHLLNPPQSVAGRRGPRSPQSTPRGARKP